MEVEALVLEKPGWSKICRREREKKRENKRMNEQGRRDAEDRRRERGEKLSKPGLFFRQIFFPSPSCLFLCHSN